MNFPEPLHVLAPVAVSLPLIAAVVVCLVARREGTRMPRFAIASLLVETTAAIVTLRLIANPLLVPLLAMVVFVAGALPVLRALERGAREHVREASVRTALLLPRSVSMYLSLPARATGWAAVIAAAACVLIRALVVEHVPVLVPSFAAVAMTFFSLYEVWLRNEVDSVHAEEPERSRRVRLVWAAQTFVTLVFLALAALSTTSWLGQVAIGVIAAIVGGVGCALALSTGVQQRYLEAWTRSQ